jgi:hypothetical protein
MDFDEALEGVCSRTDLSPPPVGFSHKYESFGVNNKTLNCVR